MSQLGEDDNPFYWVYTNNLHVKSLFQCGVRGDFIQATKDVISRYQVINNVPCMLKMRFPSGGNKMTIASNENLGDDIDIATFSATNVTVTPTDKFELTTKKASVTIDEKSAYFVGVPAKDLIEDGNYLGAVARDIPVGGIVGIALSYNNYVPAIIRNDTPYVEILAGSSVLYTNIYILPARRSCIHTAKYEDGVLTTGDLIVSGTYTFLTDVKLIKDSTNYVFALVMRTK